MGYQVTTGNHNCMLADPKIGDRVFIGAGAKILSPLSIGDDAVMGECAHRERLLRGTRRRASRRRV